MIFDDLNEDNYILYAMKNYNNPQCLTEQDFYNDMKTIKYIKRLLNRYYLTGDLKERLILNHLIVFGNVLNVEACVRILFLKIPKSYWSALKTFLIYLDFMPEFIGKVDGNFIISSDISVDMKIANILREH